ncbi:tRNA pseudouridine(55) synthase TruB [Idiomarina sp. UBA4520]|uniref:tRNA pseudouridine(55) synthase TruB n=1 Tax=Idiomarina sp. UBA4520 TaxID=1946647 RepID=UPI000B2CC36A|nr:tRNA pseudouridine(55) synthase TruB [Idiomarina sp. UBA4520]|tara:strand:+ start:2996 stop:3958 length:963 start_codon:yes stop_codon:yes gene_type:complete
MGKARPRKGRPVCGVVFLDKPKGMSSNHALQRVKRLYNAQKAGHTGALDPLATGLLPVCLGEATKFSQYLLDADKSYRVEATLGVRTTTSDAEGEEVERKAVNITEDDIREKLPEFTGKQQQSPSIYSALKHEGRPLYYYARRGIEVPQKVREITIHSIEFIQLNGDVLELQVGCSKGTYIRTLVDDLGQALGCGAHVSLLHRNGVADLNADSMLTVDQLEQLAEAGELDAQLHSVDCLLHALPEQKVSRAEARDLLHGQPADNSLDREVAVGDQCRMWCERLDGGKEFIGVGALRDDNRFWPKRVLALEFCEFSLDDLK